MSYATEVLKVNPQVTFFLAIETVGWPTTSADYSSGFDGTIFSTGDPDGDLLTRLGATTLHKTLFLPETISDSVDALTFKYSPAALTFKLNETEDDKRRFEEAKNRRELRLQQVKKHKHIPQPCIARPEKSK